MDSPILASPRPDAHAPRIPFDNRYARLPERFFSRTLPTPVRAPRLLWLNDPLALELCLDPRELASPEGVAVLAGNRIPDGAEPLAMAYAGHQFGGFSPQLGDGRAILMGEVVDRSGQRRDLQWKGSGLTPFSRTADGRAALGPVLREAIVSEAMTALGIPSTRALAAVATGETVRRETLQPGAILLRVASSHLRVGTFQYFAARRDLDGLATLARHAIQRHCPEAATGPNPTLSLLEHVSRVQARLIAAWLSVGFIHGVMNTDNSTISGETIDFGPCAFLDAYDPAAVLSSIDVQGRYAYGNQSRIGLWNLARLAEALLPLLAETEDEALSLAQEALQGFVPAFEAAWAERFAAKLGLPAGPDATALAQDLLRRMAEGEADFTLTFRSLSRAAGGDPVPLRSCFTDPASIDPWLERWWSALGPRDPATPARLDSANPAFIPRNHRVQEVIEAAVDRDDLGPFHRLMAILARPFSDQPDALAFTLPARPEERVLQTFCGT